MIKKLKNKIFWIIFISLSILVVSMIAIFTTLNYTNTLRTTTMVMERVTDFENKRPRDKEIRTIEGLYSVVINGTEVVENESENTELEEYAKKIASGNSESGITGKYLYKVMRTPQNTIRVTFMENEKAITQIKMSLIYSIITIVISIIIIYWIAKKVSGTIVKPVDETFEKQKQFISDASHELKTPLAVIEANSDVLENEYGENKWLRIHTK